MEDFDGRIFPLLGDFSRSPHIDKKILKVPDKFRAVQFQYFGWEGVWSYRFPVRHTPDYLACFVPCFLLYVFRFPFLFVLLFLHPGMFIFFVSLRLCNSHLLLSARAYFIVRVLSACCVTCTLPHVGILSFFIRLVFFS